MKKTISSNRLTIDLTDDNKNILERYKSILHNPFGTIVNNIIGTFCDAPTEVKEETLNFYKRQLKSLHKQMDTASPFELNDIMRKTQYYTDMATYLNGGQRINLDELFSKPDMVRYDIKDGYVLVPDNWIVANPEDAKDCSYAGVIECRRKDFNVPHFLFYTNRRSNEYDKKFRDSINKRCCNKWPKFTEILRQQVEPIDDPKNPGHQLNADEWMAAPNLGHFELYVKDESDYPANYEPPFGAMVVHTAKKRE